MNNLSDEFLRLRDEYSTERAKLLPKGTRVLVQGTTEDTLNENGDVFVSTAHGSFEANILFLERQENVTEWLIAYNRELLGKERPEEDVIESWKEYEEQPKYAWCPCKVYDNQVEIDGWKLESPYVLHYSNEQFAVKVLVKENRGEQTLVTINNFNFLVYSNWLTEVTE